MVVVVIVVVDFAANDAVPTERTNAASIGRAPAVVVVVVAFGEQSMVFVLEVPLVHVEVRPLAHGDEQRGEREDGEEEDRQRLLRATLARAWRPSRVRARRAVAGASVGASEVRTVREGRRFLHRVAAAHSRITSHLVRQLAISRATSLPRVRFAAQVPSSPPPPASSPPSPSRVSSRSRVLSPLHGGFLFPRVRVGRVVVFALLLRNRRCRLPSSAPPSRVRPRRFPP